jgi:hypothetical protein
MAYARVRRGTGALIFHKNKQQEQQRTARMRVKAHCHSQALRRDNRHAWAGDGSDAIK